MRFRDVALVAISGLFAGVLGIVLTFKLGVVNAGICLGIAVLVILKPTKSILRLVQIAGTVISSALVSSMYITANYWPGVLLLCGPLWVFASGIWVVEQVQPRQQRPKAWAIAALFLAGFAIGAAGTKLGSLVESLGLIFIILVGSYHDNLPITIGATLAFLIGYFVVGVAGLDRMLVMPMAFLVCYCLFLIRVVMAVIMPCSLRKDYDNNKRKLKPSEEISDMVQY